MLRFAGTIILATMMATAATAATTAYGESGDIVCAGVPNAVGMVVDNHQNLYMADRTSGSVYLVRRDEMPILIARIPGTPTALAVDTVRTIFVAAEDGTVFRVGLDGAVAEAYHCPLRPVGLGMDRDGALLIATEDGAVRKVDRKTLVLRQ